MINSCFVVSIVVMNHDCCDLFTESRVSGLLAFIAFGLTGVVEPTELARILVVTWILLDPGAYAVEPVLGISALAFSHFVSSGG